MNSLWNDPELLKIFSHNIPLIDVRAPVEFSDGSIPNSVNLPIMNNEERARVGTCYKEKGQAAAIELGHHLISDDVKLERIKAWKHFLNLHPQAQLFCFRGGLRSQISCQWLRENGLEIYPLKGGYKRIRNFFISRLNEAPLPPIIRLAGLTGSGKTKVLLQIQNSIDLEGLARHRGSTFGTHTQQPTQTTFENLLAKELIKFSDKPVLIEDESATIGSIFIPKTFFSQMRSSKMIVLKVTNEQRLRNLFDDYVKCPNQELAARKDFFLLGADKIAKKLGGLRHRQMREEMSKAFERGMDFADHRIWIELLMRDYYDPFYARDIQRNADLIVFEGNVQEVVSYLNSLGLTP